MFRKDSHTEPELSVNDLVHEVLKLIHGVIWKGGKSSSKPNCTTLFRKMQRARCAVAAGTAQPYHECSRSDECSDRARATAYDPGGAQ